ncbi:hypothetical protein BX666DRAFT_1866254 [Dichotomocladium elegans]|nr:hypothetical protein BX666DRAFT_1866254 [Dichotomocladium elegans]
MVAFISSPAHAYFSTEIQVQLPFKSMMATAARNNSMILFGGENATALYTADLYQLTATDTSFDWAVLTQNNPPPPMTKAHGVYVEKSDSFVIVGGFTATTASQSAPLQIYVYYFGNQTWVAAPTNAVVNTTVPLPQNREQHSVAIDQATSTIFIYGGAFNSTPMNDFWAWDTTTMTFTQLPPTTNIAHYGHTMSLLSTGKMVVVGGVRGTLDPTSGRVSLGLAPLDALYVFDLATRSWVLQTTSFDPESRYPSTRSDHVAVVASGDRIVIFGGSNGQPARTRAYTNSIGVLDTNWVWTSPAVGGIQPSRRAYASAAILTGQYLTVAFGAHADQRYNDINVLDLDHFTWLMSYDPNQFTTPSSKLSGGVIAGIVVASIAFVSLALFLVWRFRTYLRWLITRIHQDLWRPRAGEPLWAETARFCFEVFLLFIFALCLAFIIRQAITSPNITQRTIVPASEVDMPDIRFCFDGYEDIYPFDDPRNITVTCRTDTGYTCTDFITKLDNSVFVPVFADYLGPVTCFLFRPPSDFKLSQTSGINNGTRLLFSPFADTSITNARIHVSAYPKAMDPNIRIYNITDDTPYLLSDEAVSNWRNLARNDFEANNIFTIEPFTYSVMTYNLIDHRYLQQSGWNYVGFLPNANHTPEVETTFRQEAPNPNYAMTHADLGIIVVSPNIFALITDREVKVYTLLNALGFVGGIFGILVAVQTWMFGYRPRSPWGVVQRWSVGNMRQSLLRGLSNKFKTSPETGIPLINPVHRRFSVLYDDDRSKDMMTVPESEEERIGRVEERMQVLELLFKAYYVNDEVFRSLDNARRGGGGGGGSNRSGDEFERLRRRHVPQDPERGVNEGLFTSLEKPQHASPSTSDDGFSHLFSAQQTSIDNTSETSRKNLAPSHLHE